MALEPTGRRAEGHQPLPTQGLAGTELTWSLSPPILQSPTGFSHWLQLNRSEKVWWCGPCHPRAQGRLKKADVLVRTSCCGKTAHSFTNLNNKHVFLTALEAGKSKIKVLTDPGSGERTLPGLQMATFPCVLKEVVENRGRNLMPPPLFIRTLMPFIGAADEQITSQSPPPNTIMLGMRLSIRILGDHKHTVNSSYGLGGAHQTFSPVRWIHW